MNDGIDVNIEVEDEQLRIRRHNRMLFIMGMVFQENQRELPPNFERAADIYAELYPADPRPPARAQFN